MSRPKPLCELLRKDDVILGNMLLVTELMITVTCSLQIVFIVELLIL